MAQDIIGSKDGIDFFVGSNTPETAPTKPTRYTAPVANVESAPTPTKTVSRYSSTPLLTKPALGTVDENGIREQVRRRMQGTIDAINANYANLISQEKVAGQDRAGQTRAINARSGLIGSDFGDAQQQKTTEFNRRQEKSLVDAHNAQIMAVQQNIEDRASQEILNKKNEALDKYKLNMDEYEKAQEAAREDLKTLAGSGVDLNTLSPAQKTALLKQAGYEEGMGELIYNAMKPKPKQIDYQSVNVGGGRVLFYGVDPETGELKQQMVDVGLPDEWSMTIAPDGTPIAFNKNTGESQMLGDKGLFAAPREEDPFGDALKAAQIEKIYSEIAKGGGDEVLSVEDAKKLGVPYGTTKSGAVGVIPGSAEKVEQAETALSNTNSILSLIQTLKNHPGMDGATGLFGHRFNFSSNSRDFVAKFDQLKASLSLENISKLKGTGAISDAEQQLLSNSASALRRDGDKDKLIEELSRLEQAVTGTQTRLQNIINVGTQSNFEEFESQYGGSEGKDFFSQVKGLLMKAKPMQKIANTPYLKTLGAITGIDGSKYWKWGLDVDLKKGDKVKSPVNGTILAIKPGHNGGFGNQIRIKAEDGREIWLSHLDKLPNTKPGTKIRAGQVIALGGNSGTTYSPGGGDGSHLDITMPKSGGGYYTAREVKAYLDNKYV